MVQYKKRWACEVISRFQVHLGDLVLVGDGTRQSLLLSVDVGEAHGFALLAEYGAASGQTVPQLLQNEAFDETALFRRPVGEFIIEPPANDAITITKIASGSPIPNGALGWYRSGALGIVVSGPEGQPMAFDLASGAPLEGSAVFGQPGWRLVWHDGHGPDGVVLFTFA